MLRQKLTVEFILLDFRFRPPSEFQLKSNHKLYKVFTFSPITFEVDQLPHASSCCCVKRRLTGILGLIKTSNFDNVAKLQRSNFPALLLQVINGHSLQDLT